jgi:hypothetical protein
MSGDFEHDMRPVEDTFTKSEIIREALIIERQWDRILTVASKSLLDYNNRAEWKCAILALESYMADVLSIDPKYKKEIIKIKDGAKGTTQDEIEKGFKMMACMKKAIANSTLVAPLNYEDSDDYYWKDGKIRGYNKEGKFDDADKDDVPDDDDDKVVKGGTDGDDAEPS